MAAGAPTGRMRLVIIVLLLTMLAFASFWVLEVLQREQGESGGTLLKGEPDYTVDKFNIVRMSKTGEVRYNISGDKLLHYPERDEFEIVRPVVHSFEPKQPPLTMHAQRAVVERSSNKIHLHDQVQLTRPAAGSNPGFRLNSAYLLFLPEQDLVKTDQPVNMVSGRHRVDAVGMIANNKTREVQLLDRVKSVIHTPPSPPVTP